MRKDFLKIAAIGLLLTSCSQNEVMNTNLDMNDPNSIGFEISTGKVTRALDATIETLKEKGFGVYASEKNATADLIVDKVYKYQEPAWGWENITELTPAPKWPGSTEDYPLNFYAYYPLEWAKGLKHDLLTKELEILAPADQKDYLIARSMNIASQPATGKVTFKFQHILSKILFNVQMPSNYTSIIQAVTVKNVKKKSTFNFTDVKWTDHTTDLSDFIYRSSPSAGTVEQVTITGNENKQLIANTTRALMLMPQELNNSWMVNNSVNTGDLVGKTYLELLYRLRLTNNSGNIVGYDLVSQYPDYTTITIDPVSYTGGLYVKVIYSLNNSWEKGKAYNYIFQLGTANSSGGYLVDKNFYTENGARTNLPVRNPNGGKEIDLGSPVIAPGGTIDFEIEVESWGDPVDKTL